MVVAREQVERVWAEIVEAELVELESAIVSIPSPTGSEKEVSEFFAAWLSREGLDAFTQELEATRANVVGILPGTDGGRVLMFNSHMDTTHAGDETDLPILGSMDNVTPPEPIIYDGMIQGLGISNDKGLFVCACIAAAAIRRSGVSLRGDVMLGGVAGEIGRAQIGGRNGPRNRGKGIGARFLLTQGAWCDYAVVCEASGLSLVWALPGVAYFRITCRGVPIYAPLNERTWSEPTGEKNAVVKMLTLAQQVEQWGIRFEQENLYESACGTIHPRVNIGAIDGGEPTKPNFRPGISSIYVDVRVPPNMTPLDVKRQLELFVRSTGLSDEVTMYLSQRGYEGPGPAELRTAVEHAHLAVFHEPPPPPAAGDLSMWNDMNVFHEMGIPSIKYGPDRVWNTPKETMRIADLMNAARVYAAIALEMCT